MSDASWPVHAAPRITELSFADALTEGPRVFNGPEETGAIWKMLTQHGVDPSFALGQFWSESLFGTAGWNVWSKPTPIKSWGNVLWVNSSLQARPGVFEYKASNGYEYTGYPDWTTGVEDYCLLLGKYRDQTPDRRYGDTSLIHGATAKWMAKVPNSDEHLQYLEVVLGRMDRYDSRPPFEGDMFLHLDGITYSTNKRYEIKTGERWYPKAGATTGFTVATGGKAVFLGQVHGTSWVAVQIRTGRFSPDGKTRPVIGYVPNYDASRVTTV